MAEKIKIPTSKDLLKKYGSIVSMEATYIKESKLWLPSKFLGLNYTLGGGIPYGKILEIMGEPSSGKSMIAYDFAYCTQQLGGKVIWVDAEQAWMNSWAESNGIDPSQVVVINNTKIEYIADAVADVALMLRAELTHNEPILLVMDSVAAMDCAENIDAHMIGGKAEMGGRAKALYKYIRIRSGLFNSLGITQIYINQLRTALNVGFGKDPSTSTGGAALGFFASQRLGFYAGRTLTVKKNGRERKAGKLVTIRILKNKVAPPRPTLKGCPVYFNPKFHEVGFDRYFGLADVLLEEDVVTKGKSGTYSYKGESICRGEENFNQILEDNSKLRRKLLKEANINTISATRNRLNELTENMFPVGNGDYEKYTDDDAEEE